jgi:hypothetical protein
MSPVGTLLPIQDVRASVAIGGKADPTRTSQTDANDPIRTFPLISSMLSAIKGRLTRCRAMLPQEQSAEAPGSRARADSGRPSEFVSVRPARDAQHEVRRAHGDPNSHELKPILVAHRSHWHGDHLRCSPKNLPGVNALKPVPKLCCAFEVSRQNLRVDCTNAADIAYFEIIRIDNLPVIFQKGFCLCRERIELAD